MQTKLSEQHSEQCPLSQLQTWDLKGPVFHCSGADWPDKLPPHETLWNTIFSPLFLPKYWVSSSGENWCAHLGRGTHAPCDITKYWSSKLLAKAVNDALFSLERLFIMNTDKVNFAQCGTFNLLLELQNVKTQKRKRLSTCLTDSVAGIIP